MAEICTAPSTGTQFLSGTLNYLDCQAQGIGELGYQALSGPGSSVALALTGLLTIFIAFYGIRLLLGARLDFGETVIAVVKIGIVLTIATSWAAYRVVIYDTVMHGPAEIVQQVGRSAGLPGSDGGLVAHLQAVDDAIVSFAGVGSGRFDTALVPGNPANEARITKPVVTDDYAFGIARTFYLSGTIGVLGFVHVAAGILLALAPLFSGALLFDATRGLFAGWLRSLVATAIAAVFVTLMLTLQLGLLEPWLLDVIGRRLSRIPTPDAPFELLVVTIVFTLAIAASIALSARLAFAIHVPASLRYPSRHDTAMRAPNTAVPGRVLAASHTPAARVQLIADSVAAIQRREALDGQLAMTNTAGAASRVPAASMTRETARTIPVGQSGRRNTQRTSRAANLRDGRQ